MNAALQRFARDRAWKRDGWSGRAAWSALWPLSVAYRSAVLLRAGAYAARLLRPARASIPVVSVGNLSVGGTGKTPFALWLAQALQRRGWNPAIVLRGYGGGIRDARVCARWGRTLLSVEEAGDEAVMLAKRFSGTVIAARRRLEGAALAAMERCDVVVLDDGFQHRALARDCDVVLVDRLRTSVLPAGPLREPLRALRRADALVRVHRDGAPEPDPIRSAGAPVFEARLAASSLVQSEGGRWQEKPLSLLAGQRVATVCGIADAQPFLDMVRRWEAEIIEIVAFEDHHAYSADDWRQIAGRSRDAEYIVTTEKDLVKLEVFPFALGKLLALRIEPSLETENEFLDLVCARIGVQKGEKNGNQSGVARDPGLSEVQG